MSSKSDELIRLASRGDRVLKVRESLSMNGDEFAAAINARAAAFGVSPNYDKAKVSRLESGKLTYLTAEDAVVIALLDPEKRGVEWLVTGTKPAKVARPAPTVPLENDNIPVSSGRQTASPPASKKVAGGGRRRGS